MFSMCVRLLLFFPQHAHIGLWSFFVWVCNFRVWSSCQFSLLTLGVAVMSKDCMEKCRSYQTQAFNLACLTSSLLKTFSFLLWFSFSPRVLLFCIFHSQLRLLLFVLFHRRVQILVSSIVLVAFKLLSSSGYKQLTMFCCGQSLFLFFFKSPQPSIS